mmetsp:Transcript_28628/g.54783  ORF Transcript_28628/g.54783 Transcript_28628/m.54783 type:complete len:379 (+) Transcript_28628:233-1369(+)
MSTPENHTPNNDMLVRKMHAISRLLKVLFTAKFYVAAAFCGTWMCVSSGLIMLNKWILSEEGFNYPVLLGSLGMLFSWILSWFLVHVMHLDTTREEIDFKYWCTKILPIGAVAALCLTCGNIPYLYLSVSYIQILKALSPVFTLIVLSLCGLEKPTYRLVLSVVIIAVGTSFAAMGEIQFSWIGTLLMIASEILEAIKLAATQHLLGAFKLSSLQGTYYLCPATFLVMILGSAIMELPSFLRNQGHLIVLAKPELFMLAATMGFGVNFLSVGVIRHASSLWLKVLGQVKNAALVYGSTIIFGNIVTAPQYIGYGMSLMGFGVYSYVKAQQHHEAESRKGEPAASKHVSPLPMTMPIMAQASVDNFAQLNRKGSVNILA